MSRSLAVDAVNAGLRTFGRLTPVNPISDRLIKAIAPHVLPGESIVKTRSGGRFRVFTQKPPTLVNNPDYFLYYFGVWEPRMARALSRRLRPGDVCLDIGANIGWYTLLMSRLVGEGGAVHAFEPDPAAYARLADHVALNRATNVVVNHGALGREEGEVTFYATPESIYSSMYDLGFRGSRRISVPCQTVDSYVAHRGIERLDFIKCDVEGAELEVLQGAESTLRRLRPTMQLEVNPATARAAGGSTQSILEWLSALGDYRFYSVRLDGALKPVDATALSGHLTDVYCLPGEATRESIAA